MSIAILGTPRRSRTDRGWKISGYFQFSTTDLTGILPIDTLCPRIVGGIKLFPQGPTTFVGGQIDTIEYDAGTVSATGAFLLRVPRAGVVTAANFTVDTTVATHTANTWTAGLINTSNSNAVVVDNTAAANSNNTTGGTAFTGDTPVALTLTSTTADKTVAAGDVLELTFTKAGSASNLVELLPQVQVTATTGLSESENIYADVAALIATSGGTAGYLIPTVLTTITPNQPAVNIVRRGSPTSGLIMGFEYEGF